MAPVLAPKTALNLLDELMSNPDVTEIMVNGPFEIFVEENGELKKTPYQFSNEAQVRLVIDQWVSRVGRRVDVASPLCDFRLEDGSRVNVILPPLSLQGPMMTIRRFRSTLLTCENLIEQGTLDLHQAVVLQKMVQLRKNMVIAGNTASGKTTLLNILSGFIDDEERIITLEDAAELRLQKPHIVRLETRAPNAEGKGGVTMSDLVVNALRMRPDRLIVGECRGSEIVPMLQALNTGHTGSMTTLHSNSAADALGRLESLTLMETPHWPLEVIRQQIASAIDVVVYLQRQGAQRILKEIVSVKLKGGYFSTENILP